MDRIVKILIILAVLNAGSLAVSETTECRILQIKENRLYFDCGTESLVYPYADFVIRDGPDTVYFGEIEFSHPGISVSFPSDSIMHLGPFFGNPVEINRAHPDFGRDIDIAVPGGLFDNFRRLGLFSNANVKILEDSRNELAGRTPDIRIDMQYKKHSGYSRIDSIPAPFYFALIPNLNKPINSRGLLATALYYHHNLYKTGLLVKADSIMNYNRNYPVPDTVGRIYPYSTIKGGELFKGEIKPRTVISIFYACDDLEEFAQYFATFISRYGCNVSFVGDSMNADIRFFIIPIVPDSSTAGMRDILGLLKNSGNADRGINEKLELIDSYLGFAETSETIEGRDRYLRMADDIFQTELGVFPLFRPMIYIMYRNNIIGDIGVEYDALDFGRISRLRLPVPGKDSL